MTDNPMSVSEIHRRALQAYTSHIQVPRPLFTDLGQIHRSHSMDGGDANSSYNSCILTPNGAISLLAASYKAQLLADPWIISGEQISETCIWNALAFQDHEEAQWRGFFLFSKHPEIDDACLFYARIDRTGTKKPTSNLTITRGSR